MLDAPRRLSSFLAKLSSAPVANVVNALTGGQLDKIAITFNCFGRLTQLGLPGDMTARAVVRGWAWDCPLGQKGIDHFLPVLRGNAAEDLGGIGMQVKLQKRLFSSFDAVGTIDGLIKAASLRKVYSHALKSLGEALADKAALEAALDVASKHYLRIILNLQPRPSDAIEPAWAVFVLDAATGNFRQFNHCMDGQRKGLSCGDIAVVSCGFDAGFLHEPGQEVLAHLLRKICGHATAARIHC